MRNRKKYGLAEDSTGKISKVLFGTQEQANMQKPRIGFTWIEIEDDFDTLFETINLSDGKRTKHSKKVHWHPEDGKENR